MLDIDKEIEEAKQVVTDLLLQKERSTITYPVGTYVKVKASDSQGYRIFLGIMCTKDSWDIPRSEWSGTLSSSSAMKDVIGKWYPEVGDDIAYRVGCSIALKTVTKDTLEEIRIMVDTQECIPYIGQELKDMFNG